MLGWVPYRRKLTDFQRKAKEFHQLVLEYRSNPRIDSELRESLAEYLAGVPLADRSTPVRSEVEIRGEREDYSSVCSEDRARARGAFLRHTPEYRDTHPLTVGAYVVSQPAFDTPYTPQATHAGVHLRGSQRYSVPSRSTVLARESTLPPSLSADLDSLARRGALASQARQAQESAYREWQHRGNDAAVRYSPLPFAGFERVALLRAREGVTLYVKVYTPEGVFSHFRVRMAKDREVIGQGGRVYTPPRTLAVQGCECHMAQGGGGLLEVVDSVCSQGFPSPEARLLRDSPDLVPPRGLHPLQRDVDRVQATFDRRVARHRGESPARGSKGKRGKRNRGRGSKGNPSPSQSPSHRSQG